MGGFLNILAAQAARILGQLGHRTIVTSILPPLSYTTYHPFSSVNFFPFSTPGRRRSFIILRHIQYINGNTPLGNHATVLRNRRGETPIYLTDAQVPLVPNYRVKVGRSIADPKGYRVLVRMTHFVLLYFLNRRG